MWCGLRGVDSVEEGKIYNSHIGEQNSHVNPIEVDSCNVTTPIVQNGKTGTD